MATQQTIEERVARMEGGYEHLATKSDIAEVKAAIANAQASTLRWVIGIGGVYTGIFAGIVVAVTG